MPAKGKFIGDVSVGVKGSTFKTVPASLAAAMGDSKACADLGTASATAEVGHNVYW